MTEGYSIIWEPAAIEAAAAYLEDDHAGLQQLMPVVDRLAFDPRPEAATVLGSDSRRRLRAGTYSLVYEIDDAGRTIEIIYLGRR